MASRRSFLVGAITAASAARVFGANDRIRLGLIGAGGRGNHLVNMANANGGIEWAAVCDVWDERRDKTAARMGGPVKKYPDYRPLLDRKDIDGVIVATFDHVHSQIAMDACKAGKDVYVEKPMTSLPEQGSAWWKRCARRTASSRWACSSEPRRTSSRRSRSFSTAAPIGKVNMVRTYLERQWRLSGAAACPAWSRNPPGLDWDACLAWLPKIPWDPKRYFNRFAYWDFSTGGQTGGLFVHMVDVVHWFLN